MEIRLTGSMVSMALQGIHAAESDSMKSAGAIASGDLDHLAEHLSSLALSRMRIAANAKVMRIADETVQDVLDLIA